MTAFAGPLPAPHCQTACFSVTAAADPGVLSRVLDIFAKRGLVPTRFLSVVAGHGSDEIHVDIQLTGADAELRDRLARSLRQIVSVRSVLTSEKRDAHSP